MEREYEYDYSVVNYVQGIARLQRLLEETKYESPQSEYLFCSLVFCHVFTILDTYIGDVVRYKVSNEGQNNDRNYEYFSFINPSKIQSVLKDEYDIDYFFSDSLYEMVNKRNLLVHRNGFTPLGEEMAVCRIEVENLIYTIKTLIIDIGERITEKKAERIIQLINK